MAESDIPPVFICDRNMIISFQDCYHEECPGPCPDQYTNARLNGPLPGSQVPNVMDVNYARPTFNPRASPYDVHHSWRGDARYRGGRGQGHYGEGHYNDQSPAGHYARGQGQGHYGRGQGQCHYGHVRHDQQDQAQDYCNLQDDGQSVRLQGHNAQNQNGEGQRGQGHPIQEGQGQSQHVSGQNQSSGGGDCQEGHNQPSNSGNLKNRGQNVQGHTNQGRKGKGQVNQGQNGQGQGQRGQGRKKRGKRGRWRSGPPNQQTRVADVSPSKTKSESELFAGTEVSEIPLPKRTPPRKPGKRPKNAAAAAKGKKNKRSKVKPSFNVTFDARQLITSIRRERGTGESADLTAENESIIDDEETSQTNRPEVDIVKSNSTGDKLSNPRLSPDSDSDDVVFLETVVDNTMEVFDLTVEPEADIVPLESAEGQPISSVTQSNFKSDSTKAMNEERKTVLREIPLQEKDSCKPSDPRLSTRASSDQRNTCLREIPRADEKGTDERKSSDPRDSWRYERTREQGSEREVCTRPRQSPWKRNTNRSGRPDSPRKTFGNRLPLRKSSSRSSTESPRKRLSDDRESSGTPSKRGRHSSPLPHSSSRRLPNSRENRRNDFFNRDKYRFSSSRFARRSTPSRNSDGVRRRDEQPAHSPRDEDKRCRRPAVTRKSDDVKSSDPGEVNNNHTPAIASFSIKQTMVFKCPCGEKWKLPLATRKIYIDDSCDKSVTERNETKRHCAEENENRDTEKRSEFSNGGNETRDRSASKPHTEENFSQESNVSNVDRNSAGAHVDAQMIFKFLADFTCGCGQNVKKCAPCRALKINGIMEKFD